MGDETTRTRPPSFIGRGWPPREFDRALCRVRDRIVEALTAGDEEEARRLDEEAEVLRWKLRKMITPGREVPAAILEKFDKYEDHPPMPALTARWLREGSDIDLPPGFYNVDANGKIHSVDANGETHPLEEGG